MTDYAEYLLFQLKVALGGYRPAPLLAAHLSLSVVGGVLMQYWGDFLLSSALILTTILWLLDTILTQCAALKDKRFSPGDLARSCSKWLLWVTILFVAYSLSVIDPSLGLIGKTMQTSVLLTQSLYVVRGAALLLNNPLADQLLAFFQGRLERRLQGVLEESQEIRAITEDLQAHKDSVEVRLARLEEGATRATAQ